LTGLKSDGLVEIAHHLDVVSRLDEPVLILALTPVQVSGLV